VRKKTNLGNTTRVIVIAFSIIEAAMIAIALFTRSK
jgi:hypothetical protein